MRPSRGLRPWTVDGRAARQLGLAARDATSVFVEADKLALPLVPVDGHLYALDTRRNARRLNSIVARDTSTLLQACYDGLFFLGEL